jgi:hypothetical protein
MRRFHLVRTTDVTGVSGTGVVAHGCQFDDDTTVVRWLGDRPSTVVWASVDDALQVHGHGGLTQIHWLDVATGDPCGAQHRWPQDGREDICNVTMDGPGWHWGPHADGAWDGGQAEWWGPGAGAFPKANHA